MSVVGFDVGNDASCVAIARKVRGLDVLSHCLGRQLHSSMLQLSLVAKPSFDPRSSAVVRADSLHMELWGCSCTASVTFHCCSPQQQLCWGAQALPQLAMALSRTLCYQPFMQQS
jgi:hypothetical protein